MPLGTAAYSFDNCEAISGRLHTNNNGHNPHASGAVHDGPAGSDSTSNGRHSREGDVADFAAYEMGMGSGASSQGLFFTPVGAKVGGTTCWAVRAVPLGGACRHFVNFVLSVRHHIAAGACNVTLTTSCKCQAPASLLPLRLQFWKAKHELLICGCAVA